MTARSYVLGLLAICYTGATVAGSIVAGVLAAHTAGAEKIPVFFSVAGILVMFAAFLGDRLAEAFERLWDRHWDEHRVSWAVGEAEEILVEADAEG